MVAIAAAAGFVVCAMAAWGLTALVRRYALRRGILDLPNARSSHSLPTPRGGGLAVVVVALTVATMAMIVSPSQGHLLLPVSVMLAAFALLGWLDDHYDLSVAGRLAVQLLLATLAVYWLLAGNGHALTGRFILLSVAAVLWIVWMANLFNFMDGIDGIAGVETLVLGLVLSLWFASAGDTALAMFCLALAAAALGFLGWNWAPARIFMGDVGSVSLGACFALLALTGVIHYDLPFTAFLVLYGVFIADASLTLLRRLWRREKWWQAHRSHYYQRAVQSGFSHAQVSAVVLCINLLLAGIASLDVYGRISNWLALLLASLILAAVVFLIHSRDTRGNPPGE